MKKNKLLYVFLLICFVLVVIIKIGHGIEIDEEEALASAYRLTFDTRTSVFSINWDNLQLSSIFLLPIAYVCRLFSFNNYVILIRLITLLIQLLFSLYLYKFMTKEMNIDEKVSSVTSLLFILATPKKLYTMDHSLLVVWFFTLFTCFLYKYLNKNDNKSLYISGTMYALSVLAHPASFVVLPVILIILFVNNKTIEVIKFLTPCVFLFACFVVVFVLNNSLLLKDLPFFLKNMLSEGSHANKSSILIGELSLVLMVSYVLISITLRPILNKVKPNYLKTSSISILAVGYVTTSLVWNVFVKKPINFFEEGLLAIAVLLLVNLYYKKNNYKYIGVLYLSLFVGILILSNMPIQPNAQYLYPFIIIGFSCLLNKNDYLGKMAIVIYAFLLVFINVNYDDENNALNLLKNNDHKNSKVLNNIKTKESLAMYYDSLKDFDLDNKNVVLISNRPRYLTYVILEAKVYAPTLVSTPNFDNQWVEYFSYFKKDKYYILIDNYSGLNIENFIDNTELGQYIYKYFDTDFIKANNYLSLFEVNSK